VVYTGFFSFSKLLLLAQENSELEAESGEETGEPNPGDPALKPLPLVKEARLYAGLSLPRPFDPI